jgi:MFS transporter, DHA1 family, multidrug resistance protein
VKAFSSSTLGKGGDGWLILLGAICAVGPLSIDMYLPGAPAMAREFGTGAQAVQLSVVSYILGLVVGQLAYGPISDHVGRKPPLYVGLALYLVASVTCIFAVNSSTFMVARFLQGLGGCAGMVIARAVVRDRTEANGTARAFSLLMLVVSAAPLIAPLLGAVLFHYWGWRAIFMAMASFGVLCLVAVHLTMRETIHDADRGRLSWMSILRQYRVVIGDRRFLVYTLCNGIAQGGMYAYIAGSSFVLIDLYKVTPEAYGLIFAGNSLGMIAAAKLNMRLMTRFSLNYILETTFAFLAGLGLLALLVPEWPSMSVLLFGLFLFMTSIGFIAPNAAAIAMSGHAKNAGAASALMGTLLFAIGALCGFAVATFHDGSVRPLVVVMGCCGIGAATLYFFVGRAD